MQTVIISDGGTPPEDLLREAVREADLVIAADGGGNLALALGLTPDLLVGDLDSYNAGGNESFTIIQDPDQETNDLEKALNLAAERGAGSVTVFGATGQRLDHTLKNLSLLKRFQHSFNKLVYRDSYGDTLLIPNRVHMELPAGTILSLFPLSGKVKGITTEGLKYPLKNEHLENGVRDGLSNRVVTSPVSITYKTGDLLLFIAR